MNELNDINKIKEGAVRRFLMCQTNQCAHNFKIFKTII